MKCKHETSQLDELPANEALERLVKSKLRSELKEKMEKGVEERGMLTDFLSKLSRRAGYIKRC